MVDDDLTGRLEHQLEDAVVGEPGHDGVELDMCVDEVELAAVGAIRRGSVANGVIAFLTAPVPRRVPLDRPGSVGQDPRLEQLGVRAAARW